MLVVFSSSVPELPRTRDLLSWIAELGPPMLNHQYLIVASSRLADDDVKALAAMANKVFPKGAAIKQRGDDSAGWPVAANAMFQLAAEWVAKNNMGHWLWAESDCVPLRSGWLDALDNEYRAARKSFMGTIYPHPFPHINGVCVYPQNLRGIHPYMLHASTTPWDCVRPQLTIKLAHNTPLIQRLLADPKTNTPMTFPSIASLSVLSPKAVLWHGCKDGTLIARLRGQNGLRATVIPPKPHPIPKLLKKTKLVVVLPFCNKDAKVALATLEWMLELNGGIRHGNTVVLSYDAATSLMLVEEVTQMAMDTFTRVVTTSYDSPLPGQLPQTMAFRHAAFFMAKMKKSWIWLEPDVIPLRHGWLDILDKEYRSTKKPFMGSIVAGKGHCNGTAIYPSNTPDYICDALRMTWTAWDTAMKGEMINHCHDASHLMQHVWGVVNGKFHPFGGQAPNFNDTTLLKQIDPQAVVFHRNKDLSLSHAIKTHGLPALQPSKVSVNHKPMGTEIMIVSYHKDVEWLKYCLASIKKFATGFSGVTILVPTADLPVFSWIGQEHPAMLLLDYQPPTEPRLWHVAHQLQKFKADEWCPNAEFICHVDSDCIFTEPVTPADYFVDGKPVLWIEEFDRTGGPWRACTEKALGIPVKYDTMRHHPAVHYRDLYRDTRAMVEKVHNMEFDKYVMSCPIEHKKLTTSWNLSEFECLGNVALLPKWKDRYHFVDIGVVPRPAERLIQFWSLSPPHIQQRIPSVPVTCVPLDIIRKALA